MASSVQSLKVLPLGRTYPQFTGRGIIHIQSPFASNSICFFYSWYHWATSQAFLAILFFSTCVCTGTFTSWYMCTWTCGERASGVLPQGLSTLILKYNYDLAWNSPGWLGKLSSEPQGPSSCPASLRDPSCLSPQHLDLSMSHHTWRFYINFKDPT